ncbi:MAG: glycosyltransferase family 4 protein [Candidatus Omnitrophota bacterium]|nr:MAG: glycosyltransferase family 4 protein [Candidatus Omnitrophota bacterium]
MAKKYKIAFLISHPIQYNSPLFAQMARHPQINLTVLYCSDESIKGMQDVGFGEEIKWDIPLLERHKYKFFKNYSPFPTIFKPPLGLINLNIVNEIRNSSYDVLIIHGLHYITHLLAFIVASFQRTQIFLRMEHPLSQELLKLKWKTLIKKIIFGQLFKRISGFFAIGTENREFYEFYGVRPEKIFLTPYAVDNNRLFKDYEDFKGKKNEFKKEIGISPDKSVILFVGKLTEKKKPMDLLRAYEKISSTNKALVFVGEGSLKEKLANHTIHNNVRDVYFTGFKNQTEISKYYAMADIFVLPSGIGETWGLVVNEAMCFHLPVVVSDVVGCGKDLIRQGDNGFIFKTGDSDELAKYLENLITSPQQGKIMGENSFKIIQQWNYKADVDGVIKGLESSNA